MIFLGFVIWKDSIAGAKVDQLKSEKEMKVSRSTLYDQQNLKGQPMGIARMKNGPIRMTLRLVAFNFLI